MRKFLSLLLILMCSNLYADQSIRKCLLLPIKDNLGGALSYKIFKDVEQVQQNNI